jgi:hypothetical protein
MGHFIKWDNAEKTVVFQTYTDTPVKDDLYYLAKESSEMLASVGHRVHLIIDESNVKLNLNSADMKYLEKNVPPNQGAVVMVVSKSDATYKKLLQGIGQTVAPEAFGETYFAASIEDARELLQAQFGVQYP